MATKNIVPNADGEGQLGTSSKSWAQGHIDSITGTIATAAQGSITSLGTLTSLNISGNVGIGTTSPSSYFVRGGGLVVDSADAGSNIVILNDNNTFSSLFFAKGSTGAEKYQGYIEYEHANEAMAFGTAQVERMQLSSTGIEVPDSSNIGCASDTDLLTLTSGQLETNGKIRADNGSAQGQLILATSKALGSLVAGNTIGEVVFQHDLTTADGAVIAAVADEATAAGEQHHGARIEFYTAANGDNTTNPVNRLTVESDGNVTIEDGDIKIATSGHGINFHNFSSGATINSNLLDDYEEGTWTPTYVTNGVASTVAYNIQNGFYTKVGNQVTCWGNIQTNATTWNGDYVQLDGQPFAAANTTMPIGFIPYSFGFAGDHPGGIYYATSTRNYLTYRDAADGQTNELLASDMNTGNGVNTIIFSFTFQTTS